MENLYEAIGPFKTTTAISGRERRFQPGESFVCDPALPGETVIIRADEFFFLVDRATFIACCKWKNEGSSA
jgi:hypothetical protein